MSVSVEHAAPPASPWILVVEDDDDLRDMLVELIRSEKRHDVVAAPNGQQALTCLEARACPDLIVLDLRLPVMDGWQFRVAQKRDPRLATIPLLAISADDSAQAAAIDADVVLAKPFDRAVFLGAIDEVVANAERKHGFSQRVQADRMATLGMIAASVAHEVNNPLTYVLANLRLIEDDVLALTDAVREGSHVQANGQQETLRALAQRLASYVGEATEGSERIRGIVDDIRSFSRATGQARQPVDVRQILDVAAKLIGNEIRHRARLVREYEEVPLTLANEGRLGQACLNLLLNGVQAIPEGAAGHHELRVKTRTSSLGQVVMEISDTGHGIPPRLLPHIFEPFFTTKPVGIGTGLGLPICHGIVSELGGELSVSSVVGKGTTFRITLPPCASPARRDAATPLVHAVAQPRRLLVIDDEKAIASAIERLLEVDHTVVSVTTASQALELLGKDTQFDVILCDIHMPDASGMDLYRKVQGLYPALADRMIFMTGGTFTEEAQAFLARSGLRIIHKPFDPDTLRQIVATHGAPTA